MSSEQFSKWATWIIRTAVVLIYFMGIEVLSGWVFDITAFKSVVPGWARMAPSTALCFIIAAVSLWGAAADRLQQMKWERIWHWLPQIGGAVIVLIASLKLSEFLVGWNLGIDSLFSNRPSTDLIPARMVE